MNRLFGAALGAMAALGAVPAASAAVLSTHTLNFSFSLSDTQQNLTGNLILNGDPVTAQQAVTFNQIGAAQNLTSVTMTLNAQFAYAFAVSQQGGGAGDGIALGFLAQAAYVRSFLGAAELTEEGEDLGGLVVCKTPLCFAPRGATNPATVENLVFTEAGLAPFEGDATADLTLQLLAFPLLQQSTVSDLGPVFGYSYNFTVSGTVTLVFEGDGPATNPDPPASVPEPLGAALLLAGLGIVAARRRAAAS